MGQRIECDFDSVSDLARLLHVDVNHAGVRFEEFKRRME